MSRCKDCYHYGICEFNLTHQGIAPTSVILASAVDNSADDCPYFQDRSMLVELPCKVGDTVYYAPPGTGHINELMVVAIHFSDEKLVRKKLHKSHFVAVESRSKLNGRYNLDSFGKTVFLTREEAERALEEREKNETD